MVKADVLLITVNGHETQAVLQAAEKASEIKAKLVSVDDRLYRDLGVVNGTKIFHAISEMGSAGPGAAYQTVEKAIQALRPWAVIAVGIAFGVREGKQRIGDILVSKQLRLYELERVGKRIDVLRGDKPHASTQLINFFEVIAQTCWNGSRVISGVILTGEKLVDNVDYRDQLVGLEPETIGGEMEGAGLYVVCQDHKVDWIVIKAICDWADGKKARDKTARQKIAAKNAAEFLMHGLQQAALKSRKSPPIASTSVMETQPPEGETQLASFFEAARELQAKLLDLTDRFRRNPDVLKRHFCELYVFDPELFRVLDDNLNAGDPIAIKVRRDSNAVDKIRAQMCHHLDEATSSLYIMAKYLGFAERVQKDLRKNSLLLQQDVIAKIPNLILKVQRSLRGKNGIKPYQQKLIAETVLDRAEGVIDYSKFQNKLLDPGWEPFIGLYRFFAHFEQI